MFAPERFGLFGAFFWSETGARTCGKGRTLRNGILTVQLDVLLKIKGLATCTFGQWLALDRGVWWRPL
jgi:hypothetical protein